MKPRVSTFRIGDAAASWTGLRVAATRRPPRGIAKSAWRSVGRFDVWFPNVAPSPALLREVRTWDFGRTADWKKFVAAYTKEMKTPDARHALELLATVAQHTPLAIGCYCQDETRCHRAVLRALIEGGKTVRR